MESGPKMTKGKFPSPSVWRRNVADGLPAEGIGELACQSGIIL